MSAHLTVYEMAIAAERPVRMRQRDEASRVALAEAASRRCGDALLRQIGSALRGFRWSEVGGLRWTGGRPGGLTIVGQPAS